jgi:hypothetical protein
MAVSHHRIKRVVNHDHQLQRGAFTLSGNQLCGFGCLFAYIDL